MSSLPKLIAFDLDYTLWDLWIDTHIDGPLHRKAQRINEVLDRNNQPISFYRDVAEIFYKIRAYRFEDEEGLEGRAVIAACSRTHAPDLARQCLNLLLLPPPSNPDPDTTEPTTAITFFDELEIYPGTTTRSFLGGSDTDCSAIGSKLTHFKRLHKRTGIAYEDMLFFDDERRNAEVEKLGVTFIHVPTGLNHKVFDDGLQRWRKRRSESSD